MVLFLSLSKEKMTSAAIDITSANSTPCKTSRLNKAMMVFNFTPYVGLLSEAP